MVSNMKPIKLCNEKVRLKKLKDKEAKALEKAKVDKAKDDNKTKKVK